MKYDLKQIHMYRLVDDGDGTGDYKAQDLDLGNITTFNKVKTSSLGRIILNKINLGKFIFDEKGQMNIENLCLKIYMELY